MTLLIVACDLEERVDPQTKWIDKPVLEYLLKKFE